MTYPSLAPGQPERSADQLRDIGKSDGLMAEPRMTRTQVARLSSQPGAYDTYIAGYLAGKREDGR